MVDEHRGTLPVPADATVLLIATEGVTDPVNFERPFDLTTNPRDLTLDAQDVRKLAGSVREDVFEPRLRRARIGEARIEIH